MYYMYTYYDDNALYDFFEKPVHTIVSLDEIARSIKCTVPACTSDENPHINALRIFQMQSAILKNKGFLAVGLHGPRTYGRRIKEELSIYESLF